MPDFNVRSDSVKVEQIMEQIRTRIREKRGVDYTEQQIRELAAVKLEKFLDPKGVRSDLLEQFRRAQPMFPPPEPGNYAFGEQTLFETHRAPLRWIRRLLGPVLKLFFNPNPLIQALHIQSELNTSNAKRAAGRDQFDQLHYEVMHNLVIEITRMGIEVKNLKMRIESLTSRLEFNERRARALESVVAYEPVPPRERIAEIPPPQPSPVAAPAERPLPPAQQQAEVPAEGPGQRSRRRRRRRGRRGGGSAVSIMGAGPGPDEIPTGQATAVRSDLAPGSPELPEPAPPPSAGEAGRTESFEQGTPLAGAGPADSGRSAGEPDGEQ